MLHSKNTILSLARSLLAAFLTLLLVCSGLAGNHTSQAPSQVGAWHESLVNADGSINPGQYQAIAKSYNQLSVIDYRFGPKWQDLHPGVINGAATVKQLGSGGWYPKAWNYVGATDWFAMSGQLLYSPDSRSDPGMARARNGSYYSTTGGPYYDLRLQFAPDSGNYYNANPDPGLNPARWSPAPPAPAIASARAHFISGMPGAVIFQNGLVAMLGTGNDSDTVAGRYASVQLPVNKVPTAVCMTLSNEFILVTVWDTVRIRGEVAVIAVNGWMVAGAGRFQYGVPNWQGIMSLKLLGFVELPFKAPTSIAATSDLSQDSGRASGELSGMNWNAQSERDGWYNWSTGYRRTARVGYAIVASRSENKVAFVNLQPLFQYYRQMYFTSQANFNLTQNQGAADGQWPHAFAFAPNQTPTVKYVGTVNQPTAVAAGFHRGNSIWWRQVAGGGTEGNFANRAYATTMGGQLQIYDATSLNTMGAGGAPFLASTQTIGKNPSDIAYGAQACDANPNDLYITCRGDCKIVRVTEAGVVDASISDSRMVDPVSTQISNDNRLPNGVSLLSVMDFGGKQAINYAALEGTSETTGFLFGNATPIPGRPFLFDLAEVP